MEIKEVTVSFGCTINLGNYENMRQDIQFRAELTQEEIDDGGLDELMNTARKELAYSLHDMAEAALRRCKRWDEVDEGEHSQFNEDRAVNESEEFRWIAKLHPDMAKDMLLEVVSDYFEAKRAAEAADLAAMTPDEVDELLDEEMEDFAEEGDDYDDEDDPNEAIVPDALTAARMAHLPPEEEYSEADDRPIPGAPEPTGDIPF